MHQFGMEQYALDDKVMTADMLVSMFDDLAENLDEVGSAALATSKKIRGDYNYTDEDPINAIIYYGNKAFR